MNEQILHAAAQAARADGVAFIAVTIGRDGQPHAGALDPRRVKPGFYEPTNALLRKAQRGTEDRGGQPWPSPSTDDERTAP